MKFINSTFLPNPKYKNRNWFILDCKYKSLGHISTFVVSLLLGKIKFDYYPSIDNGDYIILINTKYIILNKVKQYLFVNKPGHPGTSLKVKKYSDKILHLLVRKSIKGMLAPKKKFLIKRLKIENDSYHKYSAQNPIYINSLQIKNKLYL
uniref:Ribosomal protein L13 n=1 Tax=Nitzschia sp. IriIs04 TaxID=1444690 RepID=A0A0S3QPN0_9STRA|nr:ribosomal protein L13 [Nitzschia sp. IriIs04]BAT70290.1 ribosomal protein L13 [Nitzschia sp. IriIs04]